MRSVYLILTEERKLPEGEQTCCTFVRQKETGQENAYYGLWDHIILTTQYGLQNLGSKFNREWGEALKNLKTQFWGGVGH